jgi:hypothetical protein
VSRLLQTGARVQLTTAEPEGEVVAPVESALAAGRRLALALPRILSVDPSGGGEPAVTGGEADGPDLGGSPGPWR